MIRRVLVGLDGSSRSERSLPWVQAIFPQAEKILVHAIEVSTFHSAANQKDHRARAEEYLRRTAGYFPTPAITQVRTGSPAATILDAAEETGADLVVVTTHGGSPTLRRFFGGTTEKLVHASPAPLLVVPSFEAMTPPERLRKMLVPLDGSELSGRILPLARELAAEHGAQVVLTHILHDPELEYRGGAGSVFFSEVKKEIVGQWMKWESYLLEHAKQLEQQKIRTKFVLALGALPGEIVQVARSEGADLIALSSHGYGGVGRVLLGSIASKLIQHAPVPVLVGRAAALPRTQPIADKIEVNR